MFVRCCFMCVFLGEFTRIYLLVEIKTPAQTWRKVCFFFFPSCVNGTKFSRCASVGRTFDEEEGG